MTVMARASGDHFRIIQFSVQVDHVHVIVEATDKKTLSLGVAGFRIRAARAFNRALRRVGPVWSGKYHAHVLRTPRETRTAIIYVLQNWMKHLRGARGIDDCSSGPWFEGWAKPPPPATTSSPAMRARTWLGSRGWVEKGGGKLAPAERPHPSASSIRDPPALTRPRRVCGPFKIEQAQQTTRPPALAQTPQRRFLR